MATEERGDDSHAERHGDVDAPVAVFSCSRLGLQANPPGRRLTFGRRRRVS